MKTTINIYILLFIFILINLSSSSTTPNIKEFITNNDNIIIKTRLNSSYYKNWTLYDDIEFKKMHTVLSFECNIIGNDTRDCKLDSNYYNDKLIAKSIDSCVILENGDSQCGILLIEKVRPYPILEKFSPKTKGGLITLVGKYLKLDTHYMLWSGNETDEITLLNIQSPANKDIPLNNLILDIPPGCGDNSNNKTSLYLVVNWNFKNAIPIIYESPKITDLIYNKNNNTITIIGDNFYNNIKHTTIKIDKSIINNYNIHSITHDEIIIKLENLNFNNIQVIIGGISSNTFKKEISTPKYDIKLTDNNSVNKNSLLELKPIIVISKINLELSDFSRVNGKLVIDGQDFNKLDNTIQGNIEIKINGVGICNDVQIVNNNLISGKLPNGVSDGSIKEVSIFINKIKQQTNAPLTFSYNLPNIESVNALTKDGGVITIYGRNFYNPFKVAIDNQDCSTPILEIRNENQSFLDEITCYIGPIHNLSIKSSKITITFNYNNSQHQHSIKTIKEYPSLEISNKGEFDKNKHLLEIIAPYSFTISMFIICSLILLFLLFKRNSNLIPKILKNK